ncbi:hypothetical protein LPJ78_002887 [Coemansia sp. RSA 989]|nr:hypothetical protein BX667DRAFT_515490 [Coemansia mojavensis]KAJ1865192.1 hypothetical protein LPJ78_002887 [Coemansia sp. RSA 989]KAJ1872521.1 hypothetical protein LPJ55_003058 [Coemansia sp. RSA 990]
MSEDRGTSSATRQGGNSSEQQPGYWCHQCQREISPMMAPHPICPRCHGDFVEQIETENDPREFLAGLQGEPGNDDEMENEFGGAGNYNHELQTMLHDLLTNIVGRQAATGSGPNRDGAANTDALRQSQGAEQDELLPGGLPGGLPGMYRESRDGANRREGNSGTGNPNLHSGEQNIPGMRTWTSTTGNGQISVSVGSFSPNNFPLGGGARRSEQGGEVADGGRRPLFIDPDENAPISLGNLVSSLMGVLGAAPRDGAGGLGQMFGVPVGNLGDYVWGQNSFDDIITQIMEQNQGVHAPPPASEEAIHKMPRRKITEEEVSKKLECGICMDEYKNNEEVMILPCKHFYHLECIDHWLKMNGTCPICRTRVDNEHPEQGAPQAPRAHSDLPGSFPSSPTAAAAAAAGNGASNTSQNDASSVPPPDPEPMD